jgi:hypothetical protein
MPWIAGQGRAVIVHFPDCGIFSIGVFFEQKQAKFMDRFREFGGDHTSPVFSAGAEMRLTLFQSSGRECCVTCVSAG